MKHSTFKMLLTQVHEKMVSLTESKGEEYKGAQDNQFGNFERTAQDTGLSREQVWLVFFNKHFDALRTYVRDMATGVERKRSESIVGRIDDAILYLILLRGMVIQNEGGSIEVFEVNKTQSQPPPFAVSCKGDEYQGCKGILYYHVTDVSAIKQCPQCKNWYKLKAIVSSGMGGPLTFNIEKTDAP